MKKSVLLFTLFIPFLLTAQIDYSDRWEDFYSYNNIKDVVKNDNTLYALADNAVFLYNTNTKEIQKLSSVNGLSGNTTSSIHYNNSHNRLIIGYENGLIEVVDEDGTITISADIVSFNQAGEKRINQIYEHNNVVYLATPFAIVIYDIDKLEFGDTYFIGPLSTAVNIQAISVLNEQIYAATSSGLFVADALSKNLNDSNNWTKIFSGEFTNLVSFGSGIYCSKGNELLKINTSNLTVEKSFISSIVSLQSSSQFLTVTTNKGATVFDAAFSNIAQSNASTLFNYSLNNAFSTENMLFLATKEFGILQLNFSNLTDFIEIHPSGPLSNSVFSIATQKSNLWFVYGGYNSAYEPLGIQQGYSHFNGEDWVNTNYSPAFPLLDMVHVSIDPTHTNRVFISSFSDTNNPNSVSTGGLLEVEDDVVKMFYNDKNSPLEDFFPENPSRTTIRINGTAFDQQGNLWVADVLGKMKLKKLEPTGTWKSFDLSSLQSHVNQEINQLAIDNTNSVWIGTRQNGAYVYNETGNRKQVLNTIATKGSLPHSNVRDVVVDKNNRVWIGTQLGLVVFNNASEIFEATIFDAEPIIILDDGIPKKLLGSQSINTIAIDGADNKWFGTDNGGVVYTNPNGQKILASFNKDNSPLASNKILKITVDKSTGNVFFATDKGVVAYSSNVAEFGDALGDVYAYPNPALKQHQTVTIDGRNGTHLPKGTNVKIVDVSGQLVYETNVVEGQELSGGKVVWDKRNLAGNKVASGVYIVLLTNDDGSETTTTKIAIVN